MKVGLSLGLRLGLELELGLLKKYFFHQDTREKSVPRLNTAIYIDSGPKSSFAVAFSAAVFGYGRPDPQSLQWGLIICYDGIWRVKVKVNVNVTENKNILFMQPCSSMEDPQQYI